jgi:rare lipoprotein A
MRRAGLPSRPLPLQPASTPASRGLTRRGPSASRVGRLLVGLAGLLALTACAEVELASHAAKQVQPNARTHGGGQYKIGDPYQIDGVWYYPEVDYTYQETGIASWYGPKFDGNLTANGEVFDQYGLTAAHRTLPMPSMVRVTNLENGRSIVVRVNDRGPFKNGRIIDLSTRSAQLLGFQRIGTAKVLVEILEPESRQLASVAQSRDGAGLAPEAAPLVAVQMVPLDGAWANGHVVDGNQINGSQMNGSRATSPAPTLAADGAIASAARAPLVEPEPDGRVSRKPVHPTNIYVQAGAFLRRDNAVRLGAQLSVFAPTSITESLQGQKRFFRVRLGPVASVEDADRLLTTLLQNGHKEARVVVD